MISLGKARVISLWAFHNILFSCTSTLKFRWLELVDVFLSLLLLFYPFPSLPVSCSLFSIASVTLFYKHTNTSILYGFRACALHFPLFCNQHFSSATIFMRCLRFDYISLVVAVLNTASAAIMLWLLLFSLECRYSKCVALPYLPQRIFAFDGPHWKWHTTMECEHCMQTCHFLHSSWLFHITHFPIFTGKLMPLDTSKKKKNDFNSISWCMHSVENTN